MSIQTPESGPPIRVDWDTLRDGAPETNPHDGDRLSDGRRASGNGGRPVLGSMPAGTIVQVDGLAAKVVGPTDDGWGVKVCDIRYRGAVNRLYGGDPERVWWRGTPVDKVLEVPS